MKYVLWLQHRRLSYSRHAVDDRDLSTQVNYRMHMNIRRMVGDQRKHHHKRSKRLNKVRYYYVPVIIQHITHLCNTFLYKIINT